MTTKEIIEVVQAREDGKPIQWRHIEALLGEQWIDYLPRDRSDFNFYSYDYRIKPEPPKPREWDLRGEHVYEIGGAGSVNALANVGHLPVRVREVLPEENL